MKAKLNTIELFSGAGGFALGFAEAGFKHELLLDFNKDACNTIRKNKELKNKALAGCKLYEGDARDFDFSVIDRDVDVISGGPPCQPFSIGGNHKGYLDDRDMFPVAIKAIRQLRPKAFAFENVQGLLRDNFADYLSYILLQLSHPDIAHKNEEVWTDHLSRLERSHTSGAQSDLTYNVVFRSLNASVYGVPQHRKRVFIVGFRGDLGHEWSFPEETHSMTSLLYSQWVSGDYWDEHEISKRMRPKLTKTQKETVEKLKLDYCLFPPSEERCRTVRDAISDLPNPRTHKKLSRDHFNHEYRGGARSYAGHTGSDYDLPAKTLKAGVHGVPGGENMVRYKDGRIRYFTVRETARLQTFPDDYFITGNWSEAMRQLGNAVPVRLGSVVANSIQQQLSC